jgi:hypothetical protein
MTERLIEPGMLLKPEFELRERLDEPRLEDERPRPPEERDERLLPDERRVEVEEPLDDEFAIVLDRIIVL